MKLLESASKLVFLLLTVTACIGFLIGKLPTESFMILTSGAFAFYFSNKGDKSNDYLGK
jgi:hypothetical protein